MKEGIINTNKLIETAQSVTPSGSGNFSELQKTLKDLLLEWNKLPVEEKEKPMAEAIADARDSFVYTYNTNVDDGKHPGLKEISRNDITSEMMIQGIRRFLSEGEMRIDGIANVIDSIGAMNIIDDFTIPLNEVV